MSRNHLVGRNGDAANAILAAAGYNFRLLIAWIALLCAWIATLFIDANGQSPAHQTG